ncbi:Spherulation-specific family 4 [Delftia tsuruhatensis]|nr:Spherulation-specific family 4 [Delftia tsuruhatensis]CAC9677694.1 Spherulation-specific family 4 [Delftia tsuruhatensis]
MQRPPAPSALVLRLGMLALTASLAACGGGGGGDSNAGGGDGGAGGGQPGVSTVTVQWTAPSAGQVVTAGTPLSLSARVQADGANVADATVVSFNAATGISTSALTSAGVATAALTGAVPGRQQVQASATVAGRTGTATQTFYLRPAPAPLRVLVPTYFYPTGAGATAWNALTASAQANPTVQMTAILNPANGIFTGPDANITRAATAFANAGGQLVGYVSSSYGTGTRSLASIQANIDNYFTHYGAGLVKGFFIDEMAATTNRLDFYRTIYQYIKAKNPNLIVIGNPGLVPVAGYADVADVLTTFEGKGSSYAAYDPRTTSFDWLYGLPNSHQASLVHNVSGCAAMQTAVQSAASARYQAGWIYVTQLEFEPSTGVGNPWAGLPNYWDAFVQTVRANNAGQALPACS